MTSSTFLREQLQLRKAIERQRLQALGGKPSIKSDPIDYYLHEAALRRIAGLEKELVALEAIEKCPRCGAEFPCAWWEAAELRGLVDQGADKPSYDKQDGPR